MLPEILLVSAAIILLYTYFGYPLLVQILGASRISPTGQSNSWTPFVSIIIAARNEEKNIQKKLENTLQLDYPSDKLEIIVSSDCSDDFTESIAAGYAPRGVKSIRLNKLSGKTAAQNAAVKEASGEVIVFSDATTHYHPDVLHRLLEVFDEQGHIGCVCGHLTYREDSPEKYEEQYYYWNREVNLRIMESRLGFIPGVAGCIYAVRKDAFVFLKSSAISDFLQPLAIGYNGLQVAYQPRAIAIEQRSQDIITDYFRRRRTIARALNGLWRNLHFINPFRNGFRAVQILSHKVLRWFSPFFLLILIVAAQFCDVSPLSEFTLVVLLLLLISGLLGILGRNHSIGHLFKAPAYFLLTSIATMLAVWDWLRGKHYITWEPER